LPNAISPWAINFRKCEELKIGSFFEALLMTILMIIADRPARPCEPSLLKRTFEVMTQFGASTLAFV
jgi:hypothetical protein